MRSPVPHGSESVVPYASKTKTVASNVPDPLEAGKNQVVHTTSVNDLDRVVKVRKYQHCEAEYLKLANEPNIMPQVRNRYLRIAQYYRELADTEPAGKRAAKRDDIQASTS
jgi:hypothetical protein